MSDIREVPPFETIYLEFQLRQDGSTPLVDEVLDAFRERSLAGVAASGSQFGVKTPVIAKIAMTMIDDSALVLTVDDSGSLTPGDFAGEVCEQLARSLNTRVIADEYVLYAPGQQDGAVDFVELDPRRQSIEQPAGFPNEWRLSPAALATEAFVYVDGQDDFTASAIAGETQESVIWAPTPGGQIIALPRGVVELPLEPTKDKNARAVLFAQGGEAKYVHLVMGKPKKQLRLTIANLPLFTPAFTATKGTAADTLIALIANAGLVAGEVQIDHPNFPMHLLPLYQELTAHENSHSFFSRVAEALQIPVEVSTLADQGLRLPSDGSFSHDPGTEKPNRRGWFRR